MRFMYTWLFASILCARPIKKEEAKPDTSVHPTLVCHLSTFNQTTFLSSIGVICQIVTPKGDGWLILRPNNFFHLSVPAFCVLILWGFLSLWFRLSGSFGFLLLLLGSMQSYFQWLKQQDSSQSAFHLLLSLAWKQLEQIGANHLMSKQVEEDSPSWAPPLGCWTHLDQPILRNLVAFFGQKELWNFRIQQKYHISQNKTDFPETCQKLVLAECGGNS